MSNEPEKLLQIKGIKDKKLKKILDKWEEKKHIKNLATALAPYGVTNTLITKIYEKFKEKSIELIKHTPYRLTEINGVGFRIADNFAQKLGIPFDSLQRVKSCIIYTLKEHSKNGHTISSIDNLYKLFLVESTIDEKSVEFEKFSSGIDELEKECKITKIFQDEILYVALSEFEKKERYIIKKIDKNSNIRYEIDGDIEEFIRDFETEYGIVFGKKQREAIVLASSGYKIFSITGYAGSGKSTVSKAILKYYQKHLSKDEIVCCALSGIASNRIKKQSSFPSLTLHSLLKFDHLKGGFKFCEQNPLPHSVILLDEASMVDVMMFYHLLKAIDFSNSTLVLLGDPAQLPPVGAGDVFSSIIKYEKIKNITLDKIYRQSEDRVINLYAQQVREGKVPKDYIYSKSDFNFLDRSIKNYWQLKKTLSQNEISGIREKNHNIILNQIGDIAQSLSSEIKELYKVDIWGSLTFFQLITPMKEGILGSKYLNKMLQERLNPQSENKKLQLNYNREFRIKDKVVHLQNRNMNCFYKDDFENYRRGEDVDYDEVRIYNGQMGVLFYFNQESDEYLVYYPNEEYIAIYSKFDFANGVLDLGYALTIHKTQGSEFSQVLIPMTISHYIMLNNKLLYTAITRAKDRLTIIGEKYAFELACKRSDETKRDTLMELLFKSNQI